MLLSVSYQLSACLLNLIVSDGVGALECIENVIQACSSYGAYNILGNVLLSFFPSGYHSFRTFTDLYAVQQREEDCMALHYYYYYILLWLGWSLFSKVTVTYSKNETNMLGEANNHNNTSSLAPQDVDIMGSNSLVNQNDIIIKTQSYQSNSNIGVKQVDDDTITIEEIILILSDVMVILLVESRVIYASCRFKLQQLEIAIGQQDSTVEVNPLEPVNKSMDESDTLTQNEKVADNISGKIIGELTNNEFIDDNATHLEAIKNTSSLDSPKEMKRLVDTAVNRADVYKKPEKIVDGASPTLCTGPTIQEGSSNDGLSVQNKNGKATDGRDYVSLDQTAKEPIHNEFDITADIKYFYPSVTLDYLRAEEQSTKEALESVTKVLKVTYNSIPDKESILLSELIRRAHHCTLGHQSNVVNLFNLFYALTDDWYLIVFRRIISRILLNVY